MFIRAQTLLRVCERVEEVKCINDLKEAGASFPRLPVELGLPLIEVAQVLRC